MTDLKKVVEKYQKIFSGYDVRFSVVWKFVNLSEYKEYCVQITKVVAYNITPSEGCHPLFEKELPQEEIEVFLHLPSETFRKLSHRESGSYVLKCPFYEKDIAEQKRKLELMQNLFID